MASEAYLRSEIFQSHPYNYERDEVYYSTPKFGKYEDYLVPIVYQAKPQTTKVLGTLDYNDLKNKPILNKTVLQGEIEYDIMTNEDIDNLFK